MLRSAQARGPDDSAAAKADAMAIVRGWQWGVADVIQQTDTAGISYAKIRDRWMVPGRSVGAGALTLVGDALHPCTPNLGARRCLRPVGRSGRAR